MLRHLIRWMCHAGILFTLMGPQTLDGIRSPALGELESATTPQDQPGLLDPGSHTG